MIRKRRPAWTLDDLREFSPSLAALITAQRRTRLSPDHIYRSRPHATAPVLALFIPAVLAIAAAAHHRTQDDLADFPGMASGLSNSGPLKRNSDCCGIIFPSASSDVLSSDTSAIILPRQCLSFVLHAVLLVIFSSVPSNPVIPALPPATAASFLRSLHDTPLPSSDLAAHASGRLPLAAVKRSSRGHCGLARGRP
ncbi:uncharacterized protein LAESUDRAFT_366115 [Laetiporus sulphureus 93-53]|uniref:Uncharacterized protein n=1 Tax=Laetiporus sulphureus 93-53 TaxID=1314785 RepID=A0A165CSJ5_9APHY|nr:uncharacterized protein LAESUDRAFT_366115 [Laetiporus sulphureus 93-53]KZT03362.1 hypothetical protein LAESUDRAFT_366115 [Laetiporus sulphureus 93-53]